MEKIFYTLSNPQKSIYLTEQYYTNSNINNICGTAIISCKINFNILEKAINIVIKNNDSFRIKFKKKNNSLEQYLTDYSFTPIELVNLNSVDNVKKLEDTLLHKVFNLEKNTYEFKMFKFPDLTGGFLLNIHHIVSDAWTLGLTCRKIMQAYSNLLNDIEETYNKKQSYIEYLNTENLYLNSEKFIKDKEYWEKKYSNIPNLINLPNSKNNSELSFSCEGNRISFVMSKKQVEYITEFCLNHKISTFNFFMAILSIYIYKISNTNNFVIGTPILNRTTFNEKNTTGMFINISPLLININNNDTFNKFCEQLASESMSLLRHQRYPYSEILKHIRKTDPNFPTLFNVLLSYQITKANNETNIPYTTRWAFNGTCADDLDIQIYDLDETKELNIAYDYKTSKFSKKDINTIHEQMLNIINQVLKNDEVNIDNIELLSKKEKEHILYSFNNTNFNYEKEKTIIDLFEEQVKKTPNDIAVVFENNSITYNELDLNSNKIANYLRKYYNVKPGDFVSILLNRSITLIETILGIVKSGATYVAIDPDYPIDRVNYMLKNCNSKVIFTNNNTHNLIQESNLPTINIDKNNKLFNNSEPLEQISSSEDLLYVIYTSGSTGTPKGVTIKHKNVHNFILGMRKIIDFTHTESMLSVATVCFDMFVFELWGSLLNGLKLVLANENEQKLPHLLNKLCLENNVDIFQTTPSRFNLLFDNNTTECFSKLKHILIGGEAVPQILFDKFKKYPNIQIHHMYGPTETTVWSTGKTIINTNQITIGTPIINTQVYILDEKQRICPIGVPGEIYISGDSVGNGYLNNPELNKETFIQNPFIPDSIMYKTGDLGFYNSNGDITYLNRIDNQIKIRGYRIELDEIEKHIFTFSEIKNCIVCKKTLNTSHDVLCAYYTQTTDIDIEKVKKYLQSKLPSYMIPQFFVKLETFPYTPNGKIDKKALPIPKIESKRKKDSLIRNKIDEKLINIISTLLEISNISIQDNLFDLGMDSLIAINLSVKIHTEFNIELNISDIFNSPIIKDLSDLISNFNFSNNQTHLTKQEKLESYPLSNAEQRIYYTTLSNTSSPCLYNISGGIIFNKIPDITLLNNCINTILNRHDSFKSYFVIENNKLVQKLKDNIKINLILENSNNSNIDKLFNEFIKPFNLNQAPLFRTQLIKLQNNQVILMLDTHHIICDGTSLNIFINELCTLYNKNQLPENILNYTDYILFEKEYLISDKFKQSEEFWINQFNDNNLPILNLPTTYPRPALKTFAGNIITKKLSKEIFNKIKEFSGQNNVTPNIVLLSALYLLLYKYTNQTDIIIGTPSTGRNLPELNNIIGMFVNTLPIRNQFDSSWNTIEFINHIKTLSSNALAHQDYSFDTLVSKINAPRDNSRNYLFDILFNYQTNRVSNLNIKDIETKIYIPNSNTSKYDISLEVLPLNDEYLLTFEYCTDLFDTEYINDFINHYENSLNSFFNNADKKLSDLSILSNEEENKLLFDFNNTTSIYNTNETLSRLFEKQVQKTPNNIAIVFEDKTITYSELNKKANQVARYLRKIGLKENSIIGIMLPRSLEVLICMLGALKAGICYIPIDPTLPKSRIEYMLKNSNSSTLLTFNSIANKINLSKIDITNIINVNLETSNIYSGTSSNLNLNINPESASYAIYTSGSTGKPKGVLLNQKALTNLTHYLNKTVKFFEDEYLNTSIVSITTISFDIFIFETLISLQRGLKVIMANETEQNTPTLLNNLIEKNNVKCIQTTPSRMNLFIKNKFIMPNLSNLNYIVLAGEALPDSLKSELLNLNNDVTIYNGYGPSETTIFSTFTDVTTYKKITIGKPLANTQIYILDKDLKPVPINKPGEIYISGDGIATKYINNEEITNERFINNPFIQNTLMYKTGDLAKYLSNGEISYIGRVDNQVKIRGLRIELDEIEKCILKYDNIENCIISVKTDNSDRQYIVAYLIINNKISINKLRDYLKNLLPKYMIPTHFIVLDNIPYLPNGKIDKKSLPDPELNLNNTSQNYVAPKTDLEIQIVNIFQNLLSISPIGLYDNFFELGGDSLLAINLQIELSKITNTITYSDIFLYPTVSDLVKKVKKENKTKLQQINTSNFTKYKSILDNNTKLDTIKHLADKNQNILLTGVTGFLGSHILDEFLKSSLGIAYCMIRSEPGITSKEKLKNTLHYYFGKKYDNLINNRIILVDSDLNKPNFGLTNKEIISIFKNISCVINSAAKVSHYGEYELFKTINVDVVNKFLSLCKKHDKKFYQISTISISGADSNDQNKENNSLFNENSLFINQSLNNVYVRSKFEAEKLVLNYILNDTEAYIIRVGNLMNRFSDYKFQPNIDENAFINRLLSFINLGYIPNYLSKEYLEFTPVDICAQGIIKIIENSNKTNRIFHLYNQNHITIKNFAEVLEKYKKIKFIDNNEFLNNINEIIQKNNSNKLLSGIIKDFDDTKTLKYRSNITVTNEFTNSFLKQFNFNWPVISNEYLNNFIKYILNI